MLSTTENSISDLDMSQKINPIFFGEVTQEGKIVLEKKEAWSIRKDRFRGSKVQLTIDKRRKKRSDKQNNYLWGACYPVISEETGHTPQELHEIFGWMFRKEIVLFNGKEVERIKHTSEMTIGEMVGYIMLISAEVATMGITLPDPKEWDPTEFR